jgi:ribosomal protein S18 acetylase RimI-like enzyme
LKDSPSETQQAEDRQAMLEIDIRHGTEEDAILITGLIKAMVTEMASYGGHTVNNCPEVWSSMAEFVRANSVRPEYIYLIAGCGSPVQTTVGMAAAYIEPLDRIFVAKTHLHLSAIYTIPSARRQGIARRLIQKVLEWGQCMNATEVDLHVLVANPARQLYEELGFQPREISMVKKLVSDQITGP